VRQKDIINAPPPLTEETFAELFATCKPRAHSSSLMKSRLMKSR